MDVLSTISIPSSFTDDHTGCQCVLFFDGVSIIDVFFDVVPVISSYADDYYNRLWASSPRRLTRTGRPRPQPILLDIHFG